MKKIIKYLKKQFSYLETTFKYSIIEEYRANTYFYVTWTNKLINIKICYEFIGDNPIGIYVYNFDDKYMYHHIYYYKELNKPLPKRDNYKYYKEIIDYAASKFYNILENMETK